MGVEIDRLEVQVEAQATKANNQLDKLVGKLNSLSNSLSHINSSGLSGLSSGISKFAQASAQLSNVKTADFTRLTKNIQSLSNLNTQQIYGAASAMRTLSTAINSLGGVSANSMQVAYVAKDISKLGGVNVQRAITNLPLLATAMNNLMATLSKAPSVNRNIIDMTNALANLASQGNRVGSSSSSIVNGLNRTGSAMASTKKQTLSLAAAFGKFYASWWLVIRGASKLWDSIENSMNYVEVLNYFDAAFGQVADSAVSQWEDAGYDSADAYYNSFSSRAKELTSKMTGFNVNDNGTLTATGNASLGINPTKLMNYQATFAQMSSSIGVASETSLLLSQALTEIGADLASVKNMDFDKVWKDMASGLAGMSRTLDKYGVNIRNVNLQQKLFNLGINENITNLNQNDKELLRAIILLDSTKYAWGDLADTLNQPANQLRLLDSNFNNLSRTLGNLFLPAVSNVLPYVNGLVIALQRLFTWVGNLLGIDISGITSAVGDGAFDIGELVEDTDDLTDSLGEASKAADKLKKGIRGFDELNIITTKTDDDSALSGNLPSGLLDEAFIDAFSEYQKVWDEAFANMENRANEFADRVEEFLQPVRDIIEDFAIGDFFKAGQDTSNLVAGIFNFFADAIDNVDWYAIGESIGDYLAGINWIKVLGSIGHLIWEALKASLELWAGAFSNAPIETALISMAAMPKVLKAITASKIVTGVSKLANNFKTLGKNLSSYLQNLDATGQTLTFNRGISDIRNNLTGLQKGVITAVAAFAEFSIISNTFEGLVDGSENVVTGILKIGGAAGTAALAMYTALGPAGLAIAGVTGLVAAVKGINDAFDNIRAEEIGETIKNAMSNPGGVPLSEITKNFVNAFSDAASGFDVIKDKSSEMDSVQRNIKNTWLEIEKIEDAMKTGVISVEQGKQELDRLFTELATLTEQKFSAVSTALLSVYGENGTLAKVYDSMGVGVDGLTDTIINAEYKNKEAVKNIIQEMSGLDPSSEKYKELRKELALMSNGIDEFSNAASDFSLEMKLLTENIDYEELFPNGELDTKALKRYLDEVSSSLTNYEESLDESAKEINRNLSMIINSTYVSDEEKAIAQAALDYLPHAIEKMKNDAEMQVMQFTDMLQIDFIERTAKIIEDGQKKWNDKSYAEKLFSGQFGGATNAAEYAYDGFKKHKENVDALSKEIEESFAGLKKNGIAWGSEAMDAIYDSVFSYSYTYTGFFNPVDKWYSINQNYKSIIENAMSDVKELSEDYGKDSVDGFNNGILENTSSSEREAGSWMEKVRNAIHDSVMRFGSPSRTAKQFGEDTVVGFNIGISENTQKTIDIISGYMKVVNDSFGNMTDAMREIGRNATYGLINGITEMEGKLYEKTAGIANNVANAIKKVLDIHSPSRVMFSLGEFTMQGFQLGMENLYGNIQKSVESFGGTLQYEIAPSPSVLDSGGMNYAQQTGLSSFVRNETVNQYDNSETNELLRQQISLLSAILQKPTIGNDDVFNAARAVYKDKATRRFGSSSAYDPVWG